MEQRTANTKEAQLAGLRPDLTQSDARLLLCAGAEDQVGRHADTPGFDTYNGWGRLNAWNSLLLATTRVEEIHDTTNRTELSWTGPTNAAGKRPFQIERRANLSDVWALSAQPDTFRYNGDRIGWSEDRPQPVGNEEVRGFYRIALRPLP